MTSRKNQEYRYLLFARETRSAPQLIEARNNVENANLRGMLADKVLCRVG